jgi:hypothetical protein
MMRIDPTTGVPGEQAPGAAQQATSSTWLGRKWTTFLDSLSQLKETVSELFKNVLGSSGKSSTDELISPRLAKGAVATEKRPPPQRNEIAASPASPKPASLPPKPPVASSPPQQKSASPSPTKSPAAKVAITPEQKPPSATVKEGGKATPPSRFSYSLTKEEKQKFDEIKRRANEYPEGKIDFCLQKLHEAVDKLRPTNKDNLSFEQRGSLVRTTQALVDFMDDSGLMEREVWETFPQEKKDDISDFLKYATAFDNNFP